MMTEFLEIVEKELDIKYPEYDIEFGYFEDYIVKNFPAILISPGVQNRKVASLSNKDTSLGFTITVIDQHIAEASKTEIKFCESLIDFFETNVEIKKNVVYANTSFSTVIQKKEEEDLNGVFLGKIKIDTQLRR